MSVTQFKVDLEAIASNLSRLREIAGGREAFAAVKADAYGHGLVPVARHLEPLVAGFGVATVDEGVELRAGGIRKPVLKFSPALAQELEAAVLADLSLAVVSADSIVQAGEVASGLGRKVSVHLKVDTGMRRVGFQVDEVISGAELAVSTPGVELVGLFTHLPVADEETGRDFTAAQISKLLGLADRIREQVKELQWVHVANSAGILNHDLTGTNAIRPGIAIYGSPPAPNARHQELLKPVGRWTSRITQIKFVEQGEGVSYGLTWVAPKLSRIATVGVGYGDGFSRRLSNRAQVLIGGRRCPVVGRVCMDQIMVDVTEVDSVQVGDEVVLIGAQGGQEITVSEMAELVGTIPYEITCLITKRVPRVY